MSLKIRFFGTIKTLETKNMLKFVLVGYLFAQVIEFQFNVLVTHNYGNWLFALLYYPVYLVVAFFSHRLISKFIRKEWIADVVYLVTWGAIGLFGMEWVIIGNTPWQNPDANQIGMLSFWIALSFMPRIFSNPQPQFDKLKKKIVRYFTAYSILTTAIGLLLPQSLRLFVLVVCEIVGYTFMNIYYWQYINKNRALATRPQKIAT